MLQLRRVIATWKMLPLGFILGSLALLVSLAGIGVGIGTVAYRFFNESSGPHANPSARLELRHAIAGALSAPLEHKEFPAQLQLSLDSSEAPQNYKVTYTLEQDLQEHAQKLLERYKPDYAAIVMMNAKTGEILAMSSFEKGHLIDSNLALKATYPAASIFKVVTASTAVDKAGLSPEHRIAYNGGNYTLYKKNVLSDKVNRWTRFISLKDAFARSINTAFGRLSLEELEPNDISDYANRFFFNHDIPADFKVEKSVASVPSEKGYELTEVASGYNRFNTMSPVHGAMIASTIINDGLMPIPYLVKNLTDKDNKVVYTAVPVINDPVITATSAAKVQTMMEQTVLSGTSRKTFKKLVRSREFREIDMGGKTGHFSGTFPKGRTDWFIGYASDDEDKVAIAAITVNVEKWTVKSAALGEMMFRKYFQNKLEDQETSLSDNSDDEDAVPEKAEKPVHRVVRPKKHRS